MTVKRYLLILLFVFFGFAQKTWPASLRLTTPAEVTARLHNERGISLTGKGAHEAALTEFNKALAISPDFVWPLFNRALVYLRIGQYEKQLPTSTR